VAFKPLTGDGWQFRVPDRVPPECIVGYRVYSYLDRLDRPEAERFDFQASYDRAFPKG